MEYSSSVVLNGWVPGNIGTPVILMTWEPGNTGKRSILIAWEPGNSPNSFSYRGSDGVGNTCLGLMTDPFAKTAANFCAQARYFVHVTFATLRRNRSVAHFRQKNTYEFVRFPFQDTSSYAGLPSLPLGGFLELVGPIFWPNMSKSAISWKWACLKISGMLVFQK